MKCSVVPGHMMFVVEQVAKQTTKFRDFYHLEIVIGGMEYDSQSGATNVAFWLPLYNDGEKLLNIMLGRGNKQAVITIRFTDMSFREWRVMRKSVLSYAYFARSHGKAMSKGRSLLDTFLFDSLDYPQKCVEIVEVSFWVRPLKHMLQAQFKGRGEEFEDKCIHAIRQDYGMTSFSRTIDDSIDDNVNL